MISIMIGVNDVWHELGDHNGVDAPSSAGSTRACSRRSPRPCRGEAHPAGAYVLQGPATLEHWDTFRQEVDLRREIIRELAKDYWEKEDLYIPCIDTQKLFDQAAAHSCPGD